MRHWTTEESDILQQSAESGMSRGETATLIGRSISSIEGRADKLGIRFVHRKSGKPPARRNYDDAWQIDAIRGSQMLLSAIQRATV